jgi:hypothetical protein
MLSDGAMTLAELMLHFGAHRPDRLKQLFAGRDDFGANIERVAVVHQNAANDGNQLNSYRECVVQFVPLGHNSCVDELSDDVKHCRRKHGSLPIGNQIRTAASRPKEASHRKSIEKR